MAKSPKPVRPPVMHSYRAKLQQFAHYIPPAIGLGLFGISIWAIRQSLRQYQPQEIIASLTQISGYHLLGAVGLTALNYVMLTGYDTLAVRFIRHPLPYRKTALVAIVSYAISNSVGMALLSGSAIRYRFYRVWQFSNTEIANIIAFCNLSFWLGLCAVGGMVFTLESLSVPQLLHLPFASVRPIGILLLAIVLAYLGLSAWSQRSLRLGRFTLPHLPLSLSLAQIAITALDWGLAASVLYLLLPVSSHLTFVMFWGIYLLAQISGILSNIPGGLGVLETVLLVVLSPKIPANELFGTLIAYRGIYYMLPLLSAVVMLGGYEVRHHLRRSQG